MTGDVLHKEGVNERKGIKLTGLLIFKFSFISIDDICCQPIKGWFLGRTGYESSGNLLKMYPPIQKTTFINMSYLNPITV